MKGLPDSFYSFPETAIATMVLKDLRELMLSTEGFAIIQGRLREIQSKHIGAGVYRVTLKPLPKPKEETL